MASTRAPITQKLVNEYPAWSTIRNDEQSNGAQFINAIGQQLQDLQEQLKGAGFNYTIPFANINDIDVLYKVFLPKSFEFTLLNNDHANPIYEVPDVVGEVSLTSYPITIAMNNDIETFWYDSIPSRVTVESFAVTNVVTDSAAANMYGVVAELTQDESPLIGTMDLDLPYTRLWVQTIGGEQYISVDETGIVQRSSIVLTGINRQGVEDTETLIFLHDDMLPTRNEWRSISRVEIYNISPSTVTVRLYAHRFGRTQTPALQAPKDFYNLNVSSESKEEIDTFYDLGTNGNSKSTLRVRTWEADDIRIRMSGFVGIDDRRSFELRNVSNVAITTAKDLAVQPFTDKLWVVDSTKLYLFDTSLTLPNMSVMDKKTSGAMSVMVPSNYHTTPGDSFDMEFFWQRQITDVIRHIVYVKKPDGTLHNVFNGSFVTYDTQGVVFNNPDDRFLRAKETYTLTDPGDYIFTMEAWYRNGTHEIDQRIISVDTKTALKQFDFSALAPGGILRGVDFDSDHNLWILVDTSGTFTKLKVRLYYDVMMIDYQSKIIFLKEEYDQIRIT